MNKTVAEFKIKCGIGAGQRCSLRAFGPPLLGRKKGAHRGGDLSDGAGSGARGVGGSPINTHTDTRTRGYICTHARAHDGLKVDKADVNY